MFFVHERRAVNRGQASLVFVRIVKGAHIEITNRSEKSIFDVRTVVGPMSMMTALTIGEVNKTPAMGVGSSNLYRYPSHEYYLLMRNLMKEKARRFSAMSPAPGDVEIPAGEKREIFVPELMFNLEEAYIVFLDAYGRRWAVNSRTRKIIDAGEYRHKSQRFQGRVISRWWIAKNGARFVWDNYMDHRKGKPSLPD